jgi:hypothetical protein
LIRPYRVDEFDPESIRVLQAFGRRGSSRTIIHVAEKAIRFEPTDGLLLAVVTGAGLLVPPPCRPE